MANVGYSAPPLRLRVLTYNTHLFGELLAFEVGDLFLPLLHRDDDRKQALKTRLNTSSADIVFLQEVWSGAFADNIRDATRAEYPNFFAANPTHGQLNRFGLAIMTAKGINILSAEKFSFSDCFDLGVDEQDSVVDKGVLKLVCGITSEFDTSIPPGVEIKVGLFCTHFMTSQSSHSQAADCSYQRLTEIIQRFQEDYPNSAVILGGDFNNSPRSGKYEPYFENLLLPATGLVNAFDAQRELDVVYHQASGEPRPIGDWKMNEGSGNLIDSTGNHAPGVPTGVPTYLAPGVPRGTYGSINLTTPAGSSIYYGPSTVDRFFNISSSSPNAVMNLDPTDCFTVMGWINPVPLGTSRPVVGRHTMISTGGAADADGGWGLGLSVTSTSGQGSRIRFTPYGKPALESDAFTLPANGFVHVAVTYRSGDISYFLNGTAIGGSTSVVQFNARSSEARMTIGGRLGGSNVEQVSGLVDGLRVYAELLSAPQIRTAAYNSVSGNTVGTIANTQNFIEDLAVHAAKVTMRAEDPGYTVDKLHNTLIHVFSKKVEKDFDSPDHIFFANGLRTSRLSLVKDQTKVFTTWRLPDGLDLSDHYPLYTELELDDPRLQAPVYNFGWTPAADVVRGSGLEGDAELTLPADYGMVVVGAGGRASGNNFVTLRLDVAPILPDGTIGTARVRNFGSEPEGGVEVARSVGSQEVVVGLGFRASGGNITTMALYAKRLDPATGRLVGSVKEYRTGSDPNHGLEMFAFVDDSTRIVTGFGARAHDNNIEGLVLHTARLTPAPESPNSYQAWRKAMFPANQVLEDSVSGPDEDPDLDGTPNVLEFGFGTNPLIKDVTNRWPLSVTTNRADQRSVFSVKVPRNTNAEGVQITFEETSNLSTPKRAKFAWRRSASTLTAGSGTEADGKLLDPMESTSVIVGAGGRAYDNNFVTLQLHVAPILADGTLGTPRIRKFGPEGGAGVEVDGRVPGGEVVVGLGFAASGGNLTAMRLYAKKLDPKTGKLLPPMKLYRFGPDLNRAPELELFADSESRIAIGFGARVHDNNVAGLQLYTGILGEAPEGKMRDAWTPIISGEGNATITLGRSFDISLKLPRVDQSQLTDPAGWPLIDQDLSSANVFVRARAVLKSAQ